MKKIIITLIMLMLIMGVVFGDEIEQLEEQVKEIEKRLAELDDSHDDVVNQKNSVIREIRSIERSIRSTEDDIGELNLQIEDNKLQVNIATLELDAAKQVLQETNEALDSRIRVMYINGSIGYFEVLLESKSFEDLLVRIEMLQRIVQSDTELIHQMDLDKQKVDEKKSTLEDEQRKLIGLQDDLEIKNDELKDQKTVYEQEKRGLETDIAALEVQIDEMNDDADKVNEIIAEMKLQEIYAGGKMMWPVPGHSYISSAFGMRRHPIFNVNKMHTGIDIPCPTGTKVVAANKGKVVWANWLSSYGKAIMIDHGGGIVTLYAHNSSLTVKKGQEVETGQTIALAGNTGNSTGPHLHFEVREEGDYVDPTIDWLVMPN